MQDTLRCKIERLRFQILQYTHLWGGPCHVLSFDSVLSTTTLLHLLATTILSPSRRFSSAPTATRFRLRLHNPALPQWLCPFARLIHSDFLAWGLVNRESRLEGPPRASVKWNRLRFHRLPTWPGGPCHVRSLSLLVRRLTPRPLRIRSHLSREAPLKCTHVARAPRGDAQGQCKIETAPFPWLLILCPLWPIHAALFRNRSRPSV